MTDSEFFVAWVDNGAFASLEAQIVFEEKVGTIEQWNADLAAGEVTFEAGGTTRVMKAQVLGSAAPGPQSWLWSWANTSISQDATSVAQQLRSYGEQHGVPEFVSAELPLGERDDGDELWKRIAIAAGAMYPEWRTYFPAPIGGGSIAPLLVQHPDLVLPAPAIPRLIRVLTQGLQYVEITSASRAISAYATVRGIPIVWEGSVGTLTLPEGHVTVTLDPTMTRVTNIHGSAGPTN